MPNFDSLTTRMPKGLTNAAPWQTMGAAGIPDPTWAVQYANDFLTAGNAADFTLSQIGGADAAFAATQGDGGNAILGSSATISDGGVINLTSNAFKITANKGLFFKMAGALDVVTAQMEVGIGLLTAGVVQNGVSILLVGGALSLRVYSGGALQASAPIALNPLVAATAFELGIEVDRQGNVAAFVNPTTGDNSINAAASQARGRVAAIYSQLNGVSQNLALPTVAMNPFVSLISDANTIRHLTLDYIVAARER